MAFASSSNLAGRAGRGRRRRGLAPLEFIIALPFLLLVFTGVLMMHDTLVAKSWTLMRARNNAWAQRHGRSNSTPYPSAKVDDPLLGGIMDVVGKVDDEIRWFQLGKIQWTSQIPSSSVISLGHQGMIEAESSTTVYLPPITLRRQRNVASQHYVLGGTWDWQHIDFGFRPPMVPRLRCFVFIMPSFDQQGYLKYAQGGSNVLGNLLGNNIGDLVSDLTGLAGASGINPADPTNGAAADANKKTQQAIDDLTDKINTMEDLKTRMNAPHPSAKDWVTDPFGSADREFDIDWAATKFNVGYGGQSALDRYYSTRTDLQNQLNKGSQAGTSNTDYNKPPPGSGF